MDTSGMALISTGAVCQHASRACSGERAYLECEPGPGLDAWAQQGTRIEYGGRAHARMHARLRSVCSGLYRRTQCA